MNSKWIETSLEQLTFEIAKLRIRIESLENEVELLKNDKKIHFISDPPIPVPDSSYPSTFKIWCKNRSIEEE